MIILVILPILIYLASCCYTIYLINQRLDLLSQRIDVVNKRIDNQWEATNMIAKEVGLVVEPKTRVNDSTSNE